MKMRADDEHIDLLSQARAGSEGGMGRLAVLVWDRLYPFVFRTTLNRDATEDILQETLLAMISRLDSLREDAKFWPWIYRIAWTKIQDLLRRRHQQSSLYRDPHVATERQGPDESVLDATIRAETLEQIAAAVEHLRGRQRDVLHLRCYEQLPYTEIASRTQTTPDRARVNFHRAKKTVRKRILAGCV